MIAGRMRHVLRLQQLTRTPDGQGGFTKDWTDIATVNGEIIPRGGAEMLHAGQLQYTNSYQARIRYRVDYTPAQRVVWVDGPSAPGPNPPHERILDVQASINPDGHKRELLLTCTERVPVPGPIT